MNYQANKTRWKIGDIVIHDLDAKEPKMLMRVTGYKPDGQCVTQYATSPSNSVMYVNDLAVLHDPAQFGINPEWGTYGITHQGMIQEDWELVRRFNHKHPIGTQVYRKGAQVVTFTTQAATMSLGWASVMTARFGVQHLRDLKVYQKG